MKPAGYWMNWENVETELRSVFGKTIRRGICPTSSMIRYAGISISILKNFGGMSRIAERLECELLTCWKARDGHVVYSFYEYIVDEYLYSIGLPHSPDVRFSQDHNYRCDQRIGDIYLEIWGYGRSDGYPRARTYNERRKLKEALYEKLGLKLVSIEQRVFFKSYAKIEQYLDGLFDGLDFDVTRQRPFDICELAQRGGFIMTEAQIVRELRNVIDDIGAFPTHKKLSEIRKTRLSEQIAKTRGINFYRKKMGYEPAIKPNNYWTLERTLEELKAQSEQLGRLPRQKEMVGSLASAIDKHGGIFNLACKLNLDGVKRPNGWWDTKEKILDAIQTEVIPLLGHFPTPKELRQLKRSDLENAISRHGGFRRFRKLLETIEG